MIRPRTIGARLGLFNAALVLGALVGLGGAGLIAVDRALLEGVDRVLRDELLDEAGALSSGPLAADEVEARLLEEAAEEHAGGYDVHFRVTHPDGGTYATTSPRFWARLGWSAAGAEPEYRTFELPEEAFRIRSVRQLVVTALGPMQVEVALRLEPEDRAMARLLQAGALAVPLVIAVAAALGAFMARRALAPVDEIERAARTIGAGPRGRRVPATGTNDELDRLARTLNDMLDRLERTAQRNLAFAGDVAHELRTPLAALRGRLEEAQAGAPGEVAAAAIGHALEATDRLHGMVQSLLALARADEGGAPSVPAAPLDLRAVVEEVVGFFAPAAEARGMHLAPALPPGACTIIGDRVAVSRAVANLLDNAVAYGPEGTTVDVRLEPAAGEVVLSVEDRGAPIDEGLRARLFERFVRGERARAIRPEGAGLGLPLVRAVARGLGGDVECAPGPSGGNVFRLRVPLAPG